MLRAVTVAALALLTAACVSVSTFNRHTLHDPGGVRVAVGERYREGARGMLDVYAPARDQPRNAPVIVFFYGGAWSSGAKEDYAFAGEAFASRGFVTFVPDYRLYPEVRFPSFVEDGAAALRWVQDNAPRFGGDPNRIVLIGHSAGAHIAMLAALDPEYAKAAGFDRHAIRGVVAMAGPHAFADFEMPLLRNVFGSVSDALRTMPAHYVARGGPPILLLHGGRDERVPSIVSRRMYQLAARAGQDAELRIYPGLDHAGIMRVVAMDYRHEAPVLEDAITFARRVTGVTVAGAGERLAP